MRIDRYCFGAALVALLFTLAPSLNADDQDKKKDTSSRPARTRSEAGTRENRTVRENRTPPPVRENRTIPTVRDDRLPARVSPADRSVRQDSGRTFGRGTAQVTRHPNGRVEVYRGPNNTQARFRTDGRVREVRTPGMTVVRHSYGGRTVVAERPGGRVVVAHGPAHGYVQRPFVVHNQPYVHRTYYVRNVAYVRVYRPHVFRGSTFQFYAPTRYYSPAFYGWAYSPWRAPVAYRWGWTGRPWYGYYGGYFAPYPVYSSPALWLTDFLFAATLEAAYDERMADYADAQARANARSYYASDGPTMLTPEVKAAISREVQLQLEAERAEAQRSDVATSSDLPPLFSDNTSHVFVVTRAMDVPNLTAAGQECVITEGDVLQSDGRMPQGAGAANLVVLASKGQDCRKGSVVSVPLQELVEMQNHLRETIDQGLEELRSKQGQGGLPLLPSTAAGAPVQAAFAAEVPPPDDNIAAELRQEENQASQAEQQVVGQASAETPATIALGQTTSQVAEILGSPEKIVELGARTIYVYKDLKVTFTDGRVTDVQ